MYNSQEIANTIRATAKLKEISLNKMFSDLSLSKNTLSSMQSGGYLPRLETISKIANYLKVPIGFLIGDDVDLPDRENLKYQIDLLSDDEFEKLNQMAQVMLPEKFSTQKDDPQK